MKKFFPIGLAFAASLASISALAQAENIPAPTAPTTPTAPATPPAPTAPTELPPNLLEAGNPGFEKGLEGWTMTPADSTMFVVNEEAASIGKKGLQVGTPGDTPNVAASLISGRVPVKEGQLCRLNFWGGFDGRSLMCDVKLEFFGADGKEVPPLRTPGYWCEDVVKMQDGCYPYYLKAIVPPGAVTADVNISTRKATKGVAYVDDISVTLEPAPAKAGFFPPQIPIEPLLADVKANPYNGKAPPKIVIKIDDLSRSNYHKWQAVVDFAQAKKIKVNMGLICQSLEGTAPVDQEYFDWIKALHASGIGEFWLHGYDHKPHLTNGLTYGEMDGRTYDELKDRFAKCQKLASDKLGFNLHTFGAPGASPLNPPAPFADAKSPHSTNDLMRVINEDPNMKVWMYASPVDDAGKRLEALGKVTILERIGLNIEYPTFLPRYDQLLGAYVHNRGRPYFVLQGHPWHWGDADFNEFVKIVEFLQSQNADFTTPSDVAASIPGPANTPPIKTTQN